MLCVLCEFWPWGGGGGRIFGIISGMHKCLLHTYPCSFGIGVTDGEKQNKRWAGTLRPECNILQCSNVLHQVESLKSSNVQLSCWKWSGRQQIGCYDEINVSRIHTTCSFLPAFFLLYLQQHYCFLLHFLHGSPSQQSALFSLRERFILCGRRDKRCTKSPFNSEHRAWSRKSGFGK